MQERKGGIVYINMVDGKRKLSLHSLGLTNQSRRMSTNTGNYMAKKKEELRSEKSILKKKMHKHAGVLPGTEVFFEPSGSVTRLYQTTLPTKETLHTMFKLLNNPHANRER